jgi:hypothetical protein
MSASERSEMMIDAYSYVVRACYKRPRGEPGLTQATTRRITASQALHFILDEMNDAVLETNGPDGAPAVTASREGMVSVITIDWSKLPDSVTRPKLPVARR